MIRDPCLLSFLFSISGPFVLCLPLCAELGVELNVSNFSLEGAEGKKKKKTRAHTVLTVAFNGFVRFAIHAEA